MWFIHQIETTHNDIEIDVPLTFSGGRTNVGYPKDNIVFAKIPTKKLNSLFLEQDREKVANQLNVTPIKNTTFEPVIYYELKAFIMSPMSYKQLAVQRFAKKTKLSLARYLNKLIDNACEEMYTFANDFEEHEGPLTRVARGWYPGAIIGSVPGAVTSLYNYVRSPMPGNTASNSQGPVASNSQGPVASNSQGSNSRQGRKTSPLKKRGGSRKHQTLKRKQRKNKSRKQKK